MTIEERLRRDDPQDKISIGEIVEKAVSGEFGRLLKAITEGIKTDELLQSRTSNDANSDRILGRLEGIERLMEDLDYMVEIKNRLVAERREDSSV